MSTGELTICVYALLALVSLVGYEVIQIIERVGKLEAKAGATSTPRD